MSQIKEHWKSLSLGQKIKYIFYAVVGLLVLSFALLNWQKVDLHLVFGKIELPITILILICVIAGYSYAKLFSFQKSRVKEKEISYLKGELNATREKLKRISRDQDTGK